MIFSIKNTTYPINVYTLKIESKTLFAYIDKNAINQNLIFFTGVIDDNEHSRTLYNKKNNNYGKKRSDKSK